MRAVRSFRSIALALDLVDVSARRASRRITALDIAHQSAATS